MIELIRTVTPEEMEQVIERAKEVVKNLANWKDRIHEAVEVSNPQGTIIIEVNIYPVNRDLERIKDLNKTAILWLKEFQKRCLDGA